MISFLAYLIQFGRMLKKGFKEAEFRGLVYSVALVLLSGTLFYRTVEGWHLVDAFYFSVITLTTVGYGDFSPQTYAGKIFTVLYIFIGLGLLLSFIEAIARLRSPRKQNTD